MARDIDHTNKPTMQSTNTMESEMEEERRKQRIAIEQKAVDELREHMHLEDDKEVRRSRWHTVKEIPLAVIVTLTCQTMIGVAALGAFAATVNAKFDSTDKASVIALQVQASRDARQDEDSRRSEDRILIELREIKTQLKELTNRR